MLLTVFRLIIHIYCPYLILININNTNNNNNIWILNNNDNDNKNADISLLPISSMMMNCLCGMVDRRKAFSLISSRDYLSKILTIENLRHALSSVWTCAEPEFKLSWMRLCSSDNQYTTAPQWRQESSR